MLRRARLLAVTINQANVYGLPHQVQQIFPCEFHETRTQINVIMDVVNTDGYVIKPNFGGIRLELHPGRMGRRRCYVSFGHTSAAILNPTRAQEFPSRFTLSEEKCGKQWNEA